MSERRASILVGAFAVGALLIAVAGALFMAGGGIGVERSKVVMVFDGSLRGLNIGAPVALRGVTVGQVTDIDLLLDAQQGVVTMVVEAEIDSSAIQLVGSVDRALGEELVERGLRAQLGLQSLLTGLLYIQLDFRPESELRLADLDSDAVQIPTIPTELEQLRSSLEKIDYAAITDSLDRISGSLDALLSSEDTQALPSSLRQTLGAMEDASRSVESALEDNTERLAKLLDAGTESLADFNRRLPQITDSLQSSLAHLESTLAAAERSIAQLESAVAPESAQRQQLSLAIRELNLAARALRSLAQSVEENPQSLLRGRREERSE